MPADWLDELREALQGEYGPRPFVAVLATVTEQGEPRARCVVCREIDDDGRLSLASDARSEKDAQLRCVGRAELVVWLPSRRQQFRMRGEVSLLSGPANSHRTSVWRSLDDQTRALFFWPAPGEPRTLDEEAFPNAVHATVTPPGNFEVIVVAPVQVECLSLNEHPFLRRQWALDEAAGEWVEKLLNP